MKCLGAWRTGGTQLEWQMLPPPLSSCSGPGSSWASFSNPGECVQVGPLLSLQWGLQRAEQAWVSPQGHQGPPGPPGLRRLWP